MKKYYDKVLFLLALAVLGLGVTMYVKGGPPASPPPPVAKPTGAAYTVIEKPTFEQASQVWNPPPDQREEQGDPGWTYSVFTPPKIYWDPGAGFSAQPPEPPKVVPFGVHLVSAKRNSTASSCKASPATATRTMSSISATNKPDWTFT